MSDVDCDVDEGNGEDDSSSQDVSILHAYLNDVGRCPILSREDELTVARRYKDLGERADFDLLVTSNLRWVVKVASWYKCCGVPQMDLIQAGNMGLMKAVEKFDPEKGSRVLSYATNQIKTSIRGLIIKNWCSAVMDTVRSQNDAFDDVQRSRKRANFVDGEDVSSDELLAKLDPVQIDTVDALGMENNPALREVIVADESGFDDQLIEVQSSCLREQMLGVAMRTLDEKSKLVVRMRHLAEVDEDHPRCTLKEVGSQCGGVSIEWARKLEIRALNELKEVLLEMRKDLSSRGWLV